jgi:hypothetical protein
VELDLSSGLLACKAGTQLLEPHLQSILLSLVWRWYLLSYLPRLALNYNLPDISVQSG